MTVSVYEDPMERAAELATKYMKEWCYPLREDMALQAHMINLAAQALLEGEKHERDKAKERERAPMQHMVVSKAQFKRILAQGGNPILVEGNDDAPITD